MRLTYDVEISKLPVFEPLQTRFAVWKFDPVQTSVVAEFLVRRFPEIPPATLTEIARKTNGNVSAALLHAISERDVARFRQMTPESAIILSKIAC